MLPYKLKKLLLLTRTRSISNDDELSRIKSPSPVDYFLTRQS
jgi:hypothetical protein